MFGREWRGLTSLPDLPAPGLGPLGGIAAALAHAEGHGMEAVLTIGCDMPGVPAELLAELVARRPASCTDAPVLGCWPTEAGAGLLRLLADALAAADGSGGMADPYRKSPSLSIRRWAETIGAHSIAAPVPLRNVNTPADLPA